MEEWKEIPEFPGYSVNRLGQVRKDSTERVLNPQVTQYGLVYVGLYDGSAVQRQRSVPLLVASVFIEKPKLSFNTPINLDGNRFNNAVANLLWRPRWFARFYHTQFNTPYASPIERTLVDLATEDQYRHSFDAATTNGLLERDVVLSIANRTYVWPTYQQFGILETTY